MLPFVRDGAQRASGHHDSRPSPRAPDGDRAATFRSVLLRGSAAIGLGVLLTVNAAGVASAHGPQDTSSSDRVATQFRVGNKVSRNGVTLTAPARGGFAWGEVLFQDGTARELMLETDSDGRVFTRDLGSERQAAGADPGTTGQGASSQADYDEGLAGGRTSSECASRSYYSYPWRIPSYRWSLQSASIPWYLRGRTNGTLYVLNQLKYAASNITGADNVCGRGDYISATHTFLGYTSRSNNISTGASCTGGDGYSVVNFGYLPSGVLGMACAYGTSGGVAREGDVRMNLRARWETLPGWCSSETLIQAAMTHEFGHVFGLGHVYSSPQTMNPYVPNCSLSPTTLGMGDLTGFERKY